MIQGYELATCLKTHDLDDEYLYNVISHRIGIINANKLESILKDVNCKDLYGGLTFKDSKNPKLARHALNKVYNCYNRR